jgi:threonine/homoserine/homoserine lactone efflux protein
LLTLVSLIGYAIAVARTGELLSQPKIRGLTGAVLLGLGLRLTTEHP